MADAGPVATCHIVSHTVTMHRQIRTHTLSPQGGRVVKLTQKAPIFPDIANS